MRETLKGKVALVTGAASGIGRATSRLLASHGAAGVDPQTVLEVLSGGYAQTRVVDVRGPRVVRGDFEPGFRSRFHYKDLNIIREAARSFECCLPASALAQELFGAMQANGWGDLDHSAVIKVIQTLSKVEARTKV